MSRIFLSAPDVGDLEGNYVQAALSSGWVAPVGPDLDAFEGEMASRLGVGFAVALSSGTAALHLGLLALGVGVGDVVLTSTMTFAATANAISYTGASPFFIDSDRGAGNLDVTLLREAAKSVRASGRRIGAIVPVDLLGKCADMESLEQVAAEFDTPLLVDAAESMGASHNGRPAGSFGQASVISFNGNKIMTTSGGGMLVSNDEQMVGRVRYLSTQARQPVAHYEHTEIGYNYRLSNILAALGRAQLCRLDQMISRRREFRLAYHQLFSKIDGVEILGGIGSQDNCWLTSIVVHEQAGWTAAGLQKFLLSQDIESRPLWKPMHLQPAFARAESIVTGNSQWLFEHGLTLPSGSGMADADFDRVCQAIETFVRTK